MLLPSTIFSCIIGVPFVLISLYYQRKITSLIEQIQNSLNTENNSIQQPQNEFQACNNINNEQECFSEKDKQSNENYDQKQQKNKNQDQNFTFQPKNPESNNEFNNGFKKNDSYQKFNRQNDEIAPISTEKLDNNINDIVISIESSPNKILSEEYIIQTTKGNEKQQKSIDTDQQQLKQNNKQQKQEIENCINQFERIQTIFLFCSFNIFIEAIIGRIFIKYLKQKIQFPSFIYQACISAGIAIILFNIFGQILYKFFGESQQIRIIFRFFLVFYGLGMTFPLYYGYDQYLDLECITISLAITISFILQQFIYYIGSNWNSKQIQLMLGKNKITK
ncbi:unnamed protein product [Paramecium sonneborni]|uniref:Transmembrane protein n=1 Tax=Paramecium sonneborni TaxID=65129 RepID=A0A8S1MR15_9CILI|nr:unnamed protein product [Paramecium sonneborni]